MSKKKSKKSILKKLKVSKKKDSKKKDKKDSKKKDSKKKDSKKKDSKKKDSKKKDSKKKDSKKKKAKKLKKNLKDVVVSPARKPSPVVRKPAVKKSAPAPAPASAPAPAPVKVPADHSSNYKVKEALVKLKSLKNRDAVMAFIKGEKRVTITKAVPAVLNRL